MLQPPEIRVRVQSDDEPSAYARDSDWWSDTDAAEIRAGRLQVYAIEILNGDGAVVSDCPNRLAGPSFEGIYDRPSQILDAWLAYYAADHWTPEFGLGPGTLIRHQAAIWRVLAFEQIDSGYGDIGANTGYLICTRTEGGQPSRMWIGDVIQVREIAA